MCPSIQDHCFFSALPLVTVRGSQLKALAAISGSVVARSLNPGRTDLLAQTGHLYPRNARKLTLVG